MKQPGITQIYKFILSVSLSLIFSISAQAQTSALEIRKTVDKLFEGMKSGDSAIVRSVFMKVNSFSTISKNAKDSVIVKSDGDAEGFIRAVGTPHKEVWDERIYNVKITTDGPMAIVWAPYKFYRGETFSHCGVNVFTLIQTANGWKIKEITDTRRKEDCPSEN